MSLRVGISLATVRPGLVGGAETYARGLISGLRALDEVSALAILGNQQVLRAYAHEADDRVELRRVRGMGQQVHPARRAARLLRAATRPAGRLCGAADDLDVVHFPVWVAAPRPSVPWVAAMLDAQHHVLPHLFSRGGHLYRRAFYDRSAKDADAVTTLSHAAKADIVEHVGVDPARIFVTHLAVDHARLRPDPTDRDADLRDRLGLPERFLFYPANLWPHKDHRTLLRALALLPDDVHLALSGQTYDGEAALWADASAAGVRDRVHHLGYVDRDDVPALYRAAAALVFPSLYEGFGQPPIEAMACACPVAVSRVPALVEVVGDAAPSFAPGEPEDLAAVVRRLLEDEEHRSERREAGLLRAATFTWRRSAEQHLPAFRLAHGS